MNTYNEIYELLPCKPFSEMFMVPICRIYLNIDITFVLQALLFFPPALRQKNTSFPPPPLLFNFPWVIIGTETTIYILLLWIIKALT